MITKKRASDITVRSSFSRNWASRIRTYKMTESESAALPFGYSPIFTADIFLGYELKL